MYRVVKRDGRVVEFQIEKIANAMKKAFEATVTNYTESVIDFLALKVTADFQEKIRDELVIHRGHPGQRGVSFVPWRV